MRSLSFLCQPSLGWEWQEELDPKQRSICGQWDGRPSGHSCVANTHGKDLAYLVHCFWPSTEDRACPLVSIQQVLVEWTNELKCKLPERFIISVIHLLWWLLYHLRRRGRKVSVLKSPLLLPSHDAYSSTIKALPPHGTIGSHEIWKKEPCFQLHIVFYENVYPR